MIRIKFSRNSEANRLSISLLILFTGFVTAALLISLAGRPYLKQILVNNNAALIGAVIEKYPQAEENIVKAIKMADEDKAAKGRTILSKYGIHGNEALEDIPSLQRYFYLNLTAYLALPAIFCTLLAWLLLRFIKVHYGQIQELTHYAGRISAGDYHLDLRDNKEGAISILKNEIYKITTTLREQAAALESDKLMLADSMADISHQLKTPLTSLLVLNDLLADNPAEPDRAKFLDRMRSQLNRIEWLVTSLLKLSKLDAGAVVMKQERVPVPALVEKTLESLGIPIEIKELQVHIEGDAHIEFKGDLDWSNEALINILKNCVEHTPKGGRLGICYSENPLYTKIRISDNGIGIAPEDLPHIFNRFYKGKNAVPDQVGIGLAMARAIVEKQGGDLTVKSRPGQGSEFIIKFYKQA